jgi:hypothetical protein
MPSSYQSRLQASGNSRKILGYRSTKKISDFEIKIKLIAKILEISFTILLWKYLENNGPWLLKMTGK